MLYCYKDTVKICRRVYIKSALKYNIKSYLFIFLKTGQGSMLYG